MGSVQFAQLRQPLAQKWQKAVMYVVYTTHLQSPTTTGPEACNSGVGKVNPRNGVWTGKCLRVILLQFKVLSVISVSWPPPNSSEPWTDYYYDKKQFTNRDSFVGKCRISSVEVNCDTGPPASRVISDIFSRWMGRRFRFLLAVFFKLICCHSSNSNVKI